ncbi:hypothetical protein [Caminibacter pacificus]
MKKRQVVVISLLVFLVLSGFLVYKSPVGSGIVKEYIFSKISFLKNFEIKSFNYSFNNFSIDLEKDNNKVSIFGNLFPFNAVYEAKLLDLEKVTKDFRGSVLSSGNIKYEDAVNISGNAILADGYGEFLLKLTNSIGGNFKGSGFDIQKLFYMIKLNFPYLLGNVDLDIDFVNNMAKTKFIHKGKLQFKNLTIPIELNGNVFVMDKENYDLQSKFKSDSGSGDIFVTSKNGVLNVKGNIKKMKFINLKELTLYPFHYHADVSFNYSQSDNILNFKSDTFEGYYNKEIYIQLKNQPSSDFFKYVNITPFIEGVVTGSISIGDKGNYDILFNNAKFLPNNYTRYILRTSGANLAQNQTIFVKGTFDKYHLVFNLLSKTKDYSLSVEDGLYSYNGSFNFTLSIVRHNRYYKYEINNAGIKLIKTKSLDTTSSETLVF